MRGGIHINKNIPRFMVVGTGSGCGKTTVVCGLLRALINRGVLVSGFKCGPDYIDPMFHSKVIGTKSRNLDLFMCGDKVVKYLLYKNFCGSHIALIEGVMGMYDGISGNSSQCSSNHLALVTDTFEILVVNVKGMSLSVAAIVKGFLEFKKNNIKGVILNNATEGMYPVYKKIIEEEVGLKVYGYLPFVDEAVIKSRHLGLITADEIKDIETKIELLAQLAEKYINIDELISLSFANSSLEIDEILTNMPVYVEGIRIGVACDKAFCFFYEDNLELLKVLGSEIVYFSPLHDKELPENLDGLIFYGGYPEEYAKELSQNTSMLQSVREAFNKEIPVIAECGGFMYLCESIIDRLGVEHKMVGALTGKAEMTKKLSRFGYLELEAKHNNLLCKKGDKIKAHEFHYSDCTNNGVDFSAVKGERRWDCIHGGENLFAGYPHIHFWGNLDFAFNFMKKISDKKR